ncbi:glycosyl hydrolase family 18 protein [Spiroplasma floricola]|uniref:chitinase n=1 Tax=Spiroplasma floricola 23-6 TaxID=1336749 RepID=A0A2K8SDZ3_9MOLU|nr:glycosyl hydrolase family 18 protein [Spiroplasma floricola]AUB31448.1 chitinase [Spiroplasma floricola 23-6]
MKILLSLIASAGMTGTSASVFVEKANSYTQMKDNQILIGYWHNFDDATGYQGGNAKYIDLTQVPDQYDVIQVSFFKSYGDGQIPTFIPLVATHPEMNQDQKDDFFANEIEQLHKKGKKVVLSLGGADAHINLYENQKDEFVAEILRLVDRFGFDGVDIDLEQSAIDAADNQNVIPQALIEVKETLAKKNREFIISMAPEFPYLKVNKIGASYITYLEKLEGYYDYINPQFYNQAGDGINVQEEDRQELGLNIYWLPQNNNELKSEFLYLIAKYIVEGKDNFYQIDADKLLWGLPSNEDAAANGQIQKDDIKDATQYLVDKDIYLKGLMTWSINWDKNSNWIFANYYINEFYK